MSGSATSTLRRSASARGDVVAAFPAQRARIQQRADRRDTPPGRARRRPVRRRRPCPSGAGRLRAGRRRGATSSSAAASPCSCAQLGVGLGAALEFVQHVGRAQARLPALRAAGHAAVPRQRFVHALEEFGGLAEQQAALADPASPNRCLQFVIQLAERGLVVGLGQQRCAQAVARSSCGPRASTPAAIRRIAQRVVFGGDDKPHVLVGLPRLRRAPASTLRAPRPACRLRAAGWRAAAPRAARSGSASTTSSMMRSASGVLVEPLRQAAEGQPGLQLVRDRLSSTSSSSRSRGQLRILDAASQCGQRVAPADRRRCVAQQRFELAPRRRDIVAVQRQRGLGRAHRQRAAARAAATAPALRAAPASSSASRAMRVARSARPASPSDARAASRYQRAASSSLPGLQREFAGHASRSPALVGRARCARPRAAARASAAHAEQRPATAAGDNHERNLTGIGRDRAVKWRPIASKA